jgi:hypothetical protein
MCLTDSVNVVCCDITGAFLYMPNTRWFLSLPNTPDTAMEMSPIPMQATASTGGNTSPLLSHIYTMHCVGDAVHASEVPIQSSIVLVLDTLSRPYILGLVRSLTE